MSAESKDPTSTSAIPACIRIGVTGHRDITDPNALREAIGRELQRLDEWVGSILHDTPYTFAVVSPLAEGADRLVAEAVLAHRTTKQYGSPWLDVVLPMPADDYRPDFESEESKQDFDRLRTLAKTEAVLGDAKSRLVAYRRAGQYIVDHCDVLFVVLDEAREAKPAGTGEMLQYAGDKGRYIVIIHPDTGKAATPTERSSGYKYFRKTLKSLRRCNRERLSPTVVAREAEHFAGALKATGDRVGLDVRSAVESMPLMLRSYARADQLSQRYRDLHNLLAKVLYAFSALAILLVGWEIVFVDYDQQFLHSVSLIAGEVLSLVLVLLFLGLAERRQWMRRWIDYRFLAESLRSLVYLKLAGFQWGIPRRPAHLRISDLPDKWIMMAQRCVWENTQVIAPKFDPRLTAFLKEAWLDDQVNYYSARSQSLRMRDIWLGYVGTSFFVLTLVAGILHLVIHDPPWPDVFSYLAIGLPACATALAGYRAQRDFDRLADRYRQVAVHLRAMSNSLAEADSEEALADILNQVREMMYFEHQGWRVVVFFHKLEAA